MSLYVNATYRFRWKRGPRLQRSKPFFYTISVTVFHHQSQENILTTLKIEKKTFVSLSFSYYKFAIYYKFLSCSNTYDDNARNKRKEINSENML